MADFISNLIKAPIICIGWIVVGVVAGMLARAIVGTPRPRSSCADFVLGIGGAIVGGILLKLFNLNVPDGSIQLYLANIVVATVGAIVLIFIGRIFQRRMG